MREALPKASESDSCIGRRPDHNDARRDGEAVLGGSSNPAEIEAYADAMADMFCACLKGLENG